MNVSPAGMRSEFARWILAWAWNPGSGSAHLFDIDGDFELVAPTSENDAP